MSTLYVYIDVARFTLCRWGARVDPGGAVSPQPTVGKIHLTYGAPHPPHHITSPRVHVLGAFPRIAVVCNQYTQLNLGVCICASSESFNEHIF